MLGRYSILRSADLKPLGVASYAIDLAIRKKGGVAWNWERKKSPLFLFPPPPALCNLYIDLYLILTCCCLEAMPKKGKS